MQIGRPGDSARCTCAQVSTKNTPIMEDEKPLMPGWIRLTINDNESCVHLLLSQSEAIGLLKTLKNYV